MERKKIGGRRAETGAGGRRQIGWDQDPSRVDAAFDVVKSAHKSDEYISRFYLQLRYARPTSVAPNYGSNVAAYLGTMDAFLTITKQLGFNVSKEVTDACTAKICQPLRPRVIPTAAKADIARSCTLLNRLQDGVLDSCGFLEESTLAWEDSYSLPNGYVFFELDEPARTIRARRVDGRGIFAPRAEGRHPVHLYFEEEMSPETACSLWPDMEAEIMKAPVWKRESLIGVDPPSSGEYDTICVRRAWRRRVGTNCGLLVVSIGGHVMNGPIENGKHVANL